MSFPLWLRLFIASGAISPLFSSSIWDTYWPGVVRGFILQCHIFLPFHTLFGVLKARMLTWCAFPSPVDHVLSELFTIHLGWPYMTWLIVSLSYTKLWSMWSFWLVFCDCGFHSVCLLTDEDKRLVEAFWWEGLVVGKTGSCSGGQGHALIFNPIFCWWVKLCFLPVVWPESKLW